MGPEGIRQEDSVTTPVQLLKGRQNTWLDEVQ